MSEFFTLVASDVRVGTIFATHQWKYQFACRASICQRLDARDGKMFSRTSEMGERVCGTSKFSFCVERMIIAGMTNRVTQQNVVKNLSRATGEYLKFVLQSARARTF